MVWHCSSTLVLYNVSPHGKLIPLMKSIATNRQQAGKQAVGGSLLIVVGCGVFWWKAGDKVSARVLYTAIWNSRQISRVPGLPYATVCALSLAPSLSLVTITLPEASFCFYTCTCTPPPSHTHTHTHKHTHPHTTTRTNTHTNTHQHTNTTPQTNMNTKIKPHIS